MNNYLTLIQCNAERYQRPVVQGTVYTYLEWKFCKVLLWQRNLKILLWLCFIYHTCSLKYGIETSRGSNTQPSYREITSVSWAISITAMHAPCHGNCKPTKFGLVLIHFRLCICYWLCAFTGINATTWSFEIFLSAG